MENRIEQLYKVVYDCFGVIGTAFVDANDSTEAAAEVEGIKLSVKLAQ